MVCSYSGWCYFFFPDGLREEKKRGIAAGVKFLVPHLPDRKNKQYVVIMDNYFTLVKTMIATRESVGLLLWVQHVQGMSKTV